MKGKFITLVLTLGFLAAFGVFMHSPPSILDGLTGATPKAKRAAQMAAPLEGNYLFCINPALEPFSDADFRNDLKAFVSGETEVLSDAGLPHMTLSVCETDYPLLCYATALCERLTAAGADVTLKQYSETMLRSRAINGRYQLLLVSENTLDATALPDADILLLSAEEMMGSFMLLGISSGAGKFLAWIGVGILAAHTVLGLLLTAQTFRASRSGGKLYGKQNALFWARRTSGLAILLMLFFHIGVFGRVQDGVYILFPFTTVRLLTQLLLVASVFVHLLLNLRPLLVSLGIVRDKEQRGDLYLILSILVLFAAGSIILYYIGWNNV